MGQTSPHMEHAQYIIYILYYIYDIVTNMSNIIYNIPGSNSLIFNVSLECKIVAWIPILSIAIRIETRNSLTCTYIFAFARLMQWSVHHNEQPENWPARAPETHEKETTLNEGILALRPNCASRTTPPHHSRKFSPRHWGSTAHVNPLETAIWWGKPHLTD